MSLFSGQGPIFWSNRNTDGSPALPFNWFGNAPGFELGLATDVLTHKESYSGLRATDARITTELTATVKITTDDFKESNQKLASYGAGSQIAGAVVADETVLSGAPVTTELYALNATGRVSGAVLEDNGSPINTSWYSVDASGIIQFSNVTGLTGPITASYTRANSRQVGVFKTAAPEIWVRLDAKNTAKSVVVSGSQDQERLIVDVFNCRMDPAATFSFISDEFNTLELNGSALQDPTKAQATPEGQFARFIYLDPPVQSVPSVSISPSVSPSASTSSSPSASASPSA